MAPLAQAARRLSALRGRLKAQGEALLFDSVALDDPTVLLDNSFMRQIETLHLHAPRAITAGLAGEHTSRRKAQSIEFADHRNYAPGDDFRLIDWNVYARLGELCLKLTEAHESLNLHLLLDLSASMEWGQPTKLLYAKRVAAALGALALASYDSVTLSAFGEGLQVVFPPLRGRPAVATLLDHLRSLQGGGTTTLREAVGSYCASSGRRGVAVLLTDFLVAEGTAEALTYLGRSGFQTTALHIVDPREAQPTLDGLLQLHDRESGATVQVGATPHLLHRYEAQFNAWSDSLAQLCSAQHAHYVRVSTTTPPHDLVLYTLRQNGLVR